MTAIHETTAPLPPGVVHQGIAALREDAEIVYGHTQRGDLPGVEAGKGYFVTPLLLRANDAESARHVHDIEVFGPVATILPYDGTAASACALIARGKGSLVTSIYGDDRAFLSEAILGMAPYNGRLVITDAKIAQEAYPPGLAMPQMLHGGPGRAGGGEELGGQRGMKLYQQRTAVQGNGPLIARLLG